MKRNAKGFTLIEIAIVLVIIGLLLGGVLKGQELITGARVRNLISQQDGIKAAFFGFQDRYRALPGDYAAASTNIANVGSNGNGNGRIELVAAGTGVFPQEQILAWNHLTAAGFLNGSYAASGTVPDDANNPKNPYSTYLQIVYDGAYGIGTASTQKHNLKTGTQVPVEIIAEVDRKVDDGNPLSGGFQFSVYDGGTGTAPTLTGTSPTVGCLTAATAPAAWAISLGSTNCGGASLF